MIIQRLTKNSSLFKINPSKFNFTRTSSFKNKRRQNRQTSQATNYYRNSIRNVNVKQSTERGKFSEHTLLHLTKIAKPQDIKLMFEAYYNYMGHFTMYSNKTIDYFVHRVLHFTKKDKEQSAIAQQKLKQMLHHHQYLRYFPHYNVTLHCAQFFLEYGKYHDFLNILRAKVLIKLNKDLFVKLMDMVTSWQQFVLISKIGFQRVNDGIIQGLHKNQLIVSITNKTSLFDSIKGFAQGSEYEKFLSSFDQESSKTQQLAIMYLLGKQKISQSIAILNCVQSFDSSKSKYVQVARKLDQDAQQNIIDRITKEAQGTKLANIFESN